MSLQRKIEKIENQVLSRMPILETSELKWAFDLAKERFESPFDETARRVEEFFQNLKQEPSTDVIEDTPNPHYEPNPERRTVKIQEYASKLARKYSDEENYHLIKNENCYVTKYFQHLAETSDRHRVLCDPIY